MFLPEKLHGKKDETIKKYVQDNFNLRKEEIDKNVKKIKKEWQNIEKKYFDLVNKIFKNHPWSKGKYIGYASVFDMYPRNIKEKTFFFPALRQSKFPIMVTGHELLHFIFFDYLAKKYNYKGTKKHGKKAEYVWQISEVFNSVIENWSPYYKILKFDGAKKKPYTGVKYFEKMRKLWQENQDIDFLLDNYFKYEPK